MTNLEKYAEQIKNYEGRIFCDDFIKPIIFKKDNCNGIDCEQCTLLRMMWANEEYTEPETDWSKVEVDTPILVRNLEWESWKRRYFAKFEDGTVYAWIDGKTLWTAEDEDDIYAWNYAKLAGEDDE